jgi:hypothetical protein
VSEFKTGMTVVNVGTSLGPDFHLKPGVVCDTAAESMTMVDFGERGDHVIADSDLVLAGGQRVTLGQHMPNGVTSDVQDDDRTPVHRTIVLWDNGDVTSIQTVDLQRSAVPRNDAQVLPRALGRRAFVVQAMRTGSDRALDVEFLRNINRYDEAISTVVRALDAEPEVAEEPADALRAEIDALRNTLRAALEQAWHGDDCETGHMARNPKCNCWRADAIRLLPDGASYADEPDEDDE